MPLRRSINNTHLRSIAYLDRRHDKDGSFPSITFAVRHTIFHTSLTLSALSVFQKSSNSDIAPAIKRIASRAIRFLLAEKSPAWTWNYWSRSAPQHGRIPDDLDDTFAALGAIQAWDPSLIDESALAHIVKALIAAETKPGGPYNTWIIPGTHGAPKKGPWRDVDLAINANVANFLAAREIVLPGLAAYIERAIARKKFVSRYYSPIPIIYFISRSYRDPQGGALRKYLLSKMGRRGYLENPLMTALAVSALLLLGADRATVRRAIDYIVATQEKDGSWPPVAFYIEEIKDGVPLRSGSRALTTAVCTEALGRYELEYGPNKKATEYGDLTSKQRAGEIHISGEIVTSVKRRFVHASLAMQNIIFPFVDKIAAQDPRHEIILLSYFFAHAMHGAGPASNGKNIPPKKILLDLGVANLLGWAGYTICDKILDGESPVAWLPAANIAIREVSVIFGSVFRGDAAAYAMVRRILDAIEETNLWEHAACTLKKSGTRRLLPRSLPDYDAGGRKNLRLAEKSLGHALGPIAIVLLSAPGTHTGRHAQGLRRAIMVRKYFEHYLIARQLNDDAHDWFADLDAGFLNGASVPLIARWKKIYPRRAHVIDVARDKEKLQVLFWNDIVDDVSREIMLHCTKARALLGSMKFLADTSFLEGLIAPLERSAKKAVAERDAGKKFIKSFEN